MILDEFALRGWFETPNGRQVRIFPRGIGRGGVQPEQRSAVLIWLDARRRETPFGTPYEGGVDIYTGTEWIPFTNLHGADMWSKKIRMAVRS